MSNLPSSVVPTAGAITNNEYNDLHHHRRYLLQELADQDARSQKLLRDCEANEKALAAIESINEPNKSGRRLRNAIKVITRKISECENAERVAHENLAITSHRMQTLETVETIHQQQWRTACQRYEQQVQLNQVETMSTGLRNLTLIQSPTTGFAMNNQGYVSPVTPGFTPLWIPNVYPSPFSPLVSPWMPPTPVLQPYQGYLSEPHSCPVESRWPAGETVISTSSGTYPQLIPQPMMSAALQQRSQINLYEVDPSEKDDGVEQSYWQAAETVNWNDPATKPQIEQLVSPTCLSYPAKKFVSRTASVEPRRTASLPDISMDQSTMDSSMAGAEEEDVKGETKTFFNEELTRHLSLVDHSRATEATQRLKNFQNRKRKMAGR